MNYKEEQKQHQIKLLGNPIIFVPGTDGGGIYPGNRKSYPHILKDGKRNLRPVIQEEVCNYFKNNNIQWWSGSVTGNLLSSQIACLNHLFSIRNDKNLVLKILQRIDPEFDDVLINLNDCFSPQYISFEVVSNSDLLNEGKLIRGANCTSVDAMIIARKTDKNTYLIPIEWKYTEQEKSDKSNNEKRHELYDKLINESKCFHTTAAKLDKVLYKEPYYELMRQTLLSELIVNKEPEKWQGVTDFLHLHVVPKGNIAFRGRNGEMEETWTSCLTDSKRYKLIDPSELFEPIKDEPKCKELIRYLNERYWN